MKSRIVGLNRVTTGLTQRIWFNTTFVFDFTRKTSNGIGTRQRESNKGEWRKDLVFVGGRKGATGEVREVVSMNICFT